MYAAQFQDHLSREKYWTFSRRFRTVQATQMSCLMYVRSRQVTWIVTCAYCASGKQKKTKQQQQQTITKPTNQPTKKPKTQ